MLTKSSAQTIATGVNTGKNAVAIKTLCGCVKSQILSPHGLIPKAGQLLAANTFDIVSVE